MLRLKVNKVRDGLHPSEAVVEVVTADGQRECLVVDHRSLLNDTLRIGYPVGRENGRLLVELPRETLRGLWRVWVKEDSVVEEALA